MGGGDNEGMEVNLDESTNGKLVVWGPVVWDSRDPPK